MLYSLSSRNVQRKYVQSKVGRKIGVSSLGVKNIHYYKTKKRGDRGLSLQICITKKKMEREQVYFFPSICSF